MGVTVDLPNKMTGTQIVETFLSVLPYECVAHNYSGDKYDGRRRWEGSKVETYDEVRGEATLYNWHEGFAGILGLFQSAPGWQSDVGGASGPQQIIMSFVEPGRLYTKARLHLGKKLYDAEGYAPGWHEHLEYDDIEFGPDFKEIKKLFELALDRAAGQRKSRRGP